MSSDLDLPLAKIRDTLEREKSRGRKVRVSRLEQKLSLHVAEINTITVIRKINP